MTSQPGTPESYPQTPSPEYAQAPAAAYEPQQPRPSTPTTLAYTNTFALVAIILAFIVPIAGIVFGHMGLNQIKRNGDSGRGLALTGLIVGYAYVVMIALIFIAYIGMIVVMFASFGAAMGNFDSFDSYS